MVKSHEYILNSMGFLWWFKSHSIVVVLPHCWWRFSLSSIVITSSGALMVDERSLGSYELEEDAAVIVPRRARSFGTFWSPQKVGFGLWTYGFSWFFTWFCFCKKKQLHDVTHDHWIVNDFRYQWTLEFSHEPVNISLLIGQYRGLYWGGVLQIMISNN